VGGLGGGGGGGLFFLGGWGGVWGGGGGGVLRLQSSLSGDVLEASLYVGIICQKKWKEGASKT